MSHPKELMPAFEQARRIHRRHGTSYYFATRLFPEEMRLATFALYAFFRVPDEIVDNPAPGVAGECDSVHRCLENWRTRWAAAYASGDSEDPVLRVNAYIFHRYAIPFEYSMAFLDAMDQDTTQASYCTYSDLCRYMYGSAGVVGLMMAHVIGFSHPETALPCAEKLGYAMQLTNFLRDIDEDYQLRGRIYMPQDEMDAFGITEADFAGRRFTPAFRRFVQFQAARAEQLYTEAQAGIPLLHPEGQPAVQVAHALYRAILTRLAAQDWNVFEGRARTSLPEKVMLAIGALWSVYARTEGSCYWGRHRRTGNRLSARAEGIHCSGR